MCNNVLVNCPRDKARNESLYERNIVMKLLIFGGTGFLGRYIVKAACSAGHEVTLFNRGASHPELFAELEQLRGDVDGGTEPLKGRSWDAAIDTCSMFPRAVRSLTTLLADAVAHYTYISSTSVYADFDRVGIDESYPVSTLEDETLEEDKPHYYGGLKALCEKAAEVGMPGRVLTIRPGLLVGPFDATDRFTYWPQRIALGGEVIAPGNPDQQVQFIDARDLAAWIVHMIQNRQTGVYNAKGPLPHALTMQTLLETCKVVTESDARFVWLDEHFLLEHEVAPYRDMPLWVPSDMIGFATVSSQKALAHGLTYRPLAETIQDTLDWNATRPATDEIKAGLKPDREQELLQLWYSYLAI